MRPLVGTVTNNKVAFALGDTLTSNTNFHFDNSTTKLGIGNASPDSTLTVTGGIRATTGVTAARFTATGSAVPTNGMYLPATNALAFSTNSTERMRITSAGDIGIGITNPSAGLVLKKTSASINPAMWLNSSNIDHPFTGIGFVPEVDSTVAGTLAMRNITNGGMQFNAFTVNGTTIAGIGLELNAHIGSNLDPSYTAIAFQGWKTNGIAGRTPLTGSEKVMEIRTGSTGLVTVQGNGNTGISTTSPTALLHLAAGTANTAPLKFTSGTNLTTPEAGAVEWNGTNVFVTNSSATRQTVNQGLTGSATMDFLSTDAQKSRDLTITVTGASDGDVVSLGVSNAAVSANTCYTAWVSAANTVTIRFNNYSNVAVDPAQGNFKVFVTKF